MKSVRKGCLQKWNKKFKGEGEEYGRVKRRQDEWNFGSDGAKQLLEWRYQKGVQLEVRRGLDHGLSGGRLIRGDCIYQ